MITLYVICGFLVGFFTGSSLDSQAQVATIQGHTVTLEQELHSLPPDWWSANFEKAAKYHCKEFDVLEKTNQPYTLTAANLKPDTQYWVIRCK